MKAVWMFWLPLVFLPGFGVGAATAHGVIELSDYLIGPLLILTVLGRRRRGRLYVDDLIPALWAFIGWSLLSTMLIRERFDYPDDHYVVFGFLKLGKFALYGLTGLLASRAVADDKDHHAFMWSLLLAGLVVAAALSVFSGREYWIQSGDTVAGYKANNGISVLMGMLLCYFGGHWIAHWGSYRWRAVALPGMFFMIVGFFLSEGRGGWIGGILGAGYILYRRGLKGRVIFGLTAAAFLTVIAYATVPTFTGAIDRTIHPEASYMAGAVQVIPGVDDGNRLYIWGHEVVKLVASPVLGTGFYHRGAASGLYANGSHNFFLQITLETGVIGGYLILWVFARMWRQAGTDAARAAGQEIPLRAALIAAIVGNISGEYFYGSTPLLGLMLIYARVGGLPAHGPAHDDPRAFDPPLVTDASYHSLGDSRQATGPGFDHSQSF
jgi:O-antigen ligase